MWYAITTGGNSKLRVDRIYVRVLSILFSYD